MDSSLRAARSVPGGREADVAPVRQRDLLPTKAQIEAISSVPDLEAMRDEIDRRIARIETDLDFRDDTAEWEARALSALSIHRYTANLISRRVKVLQRNKTSPFAPVAAVAVSVRERTECNPLSWKLINDDLDLAADDTADGLEAALRTLSDAMLALEGDRADEISRFAQGSRDEAWLVEANYALRRARERRHTLGLKKAAIRRAAKDAAQELRDRGRAQAFVDEARDFLPRDTFLTLWDRVERKLSAPPETRTAGYEAPTGRSEPKDAPDIQGEGT